MEVTGVCSLCECIAIKLRIFADGSALAQCVQCDTTVESDKLSDILFHFSIEDVPELPQEK